MPPYTGPLHPYVGLRAEDTVDTVILKDGQRVGPFRYAGVVAFVAEEHQRVGEVSHGGVVAVLLLADGRHVSIPIARVKLHPDDIVEAGRRLAALVSALTAPGARPTADQLDELREPFDG